MILAVDCGSTNMKVGLFDRQMTRLAVDTRPVRYLNPERTEFDPQQAWRDLKAMLDGVGGGRRVEKIAVASQAQTFTILGPDGAARMPFLSWADKRATELPDLPEFHRHCSFGSPLPQLELSKLLWVRRRHPEWLTLEARVVCLQEYFTLRLAGEPVVDANLAAMSGMYSMARSDWWAEALQVVGVRPDQLGRVVDIGDGVGAVVCAGNDQTAGAYAAGGELVVTLGTALVVYRRAGSAPGPFHPGGCWGPHPGGGYYELATADEGGAALSWAVDVLTPGDEPGFLSAAESAPPGAALFFPFRMRTDTAWTGATDVPARSRAVLEGVCFRARELMEEDLGIHPSGSVRVTGGGSSSALWMQLLAEVLGSPVERATGDPLLGAACIASGRTVRDAAPSTDRYVPRAAELYDDLYRRWRELARISLPAPAPAPGVEPGLGGHA